MLRLEGLLVKFVGTNSLAVARISPRGFSSTSKEVTDVVSSNGGGRADGVEVERKPGGIVALKDGGAGTRPLPYDDTVESSAIDVY